MTTEQKTRQIENHESELRSVLDVMKAVRYQGQDLPIADRNDTLEALKSMCSDIGAKLNTVQAIDAV